MTVHAKFEMKGVLITGIVLLVREGLECSRGALFFLFFLRAVLLFDCALSAKTKTICVTPCPALDDSSVSLRG